jgi:hypothetical protein
MPTTTLNIHSVPESSFGFKRHFEYDSNGRISSITVASFDAIHNDTCWKTEYTYEGNNLVNAIDILTEWNEAWG